MSAQGQNWELFGYDMRRIAGHWQAAWRDFLWGYDSPVKARLDEVVRLESEHGVDYFHAGSPVQINDAECDAYLLPDEMVLTRTLRLPVAAEADINAVMAFEVVANSPFPESDTGHGWKIDQRGEEFLQVQLAIVSLSATMTYLGKTYDCHDAQAREVWAKMSDSVIVLEGFGEQKRLGRYNRRLIRMATALGLSILLLVLISALAAGFKYLEWDKLQEMSAEVEVAAEKPAQMRVALLSANEAIAGANVVISQYPGPHRALTELSELLGDDVSLEYLSMTGRQIKVRGLARNAAAVIQQLTEEPSYASVKSPQAITKQGTGGMERFFLDITLADD
ncbi:MAG: PilN domain-containing protein [Halioglobus sp.]